MKKAYIYPMPSFEDENNKDSYMRKFIESFSDNFEFLNKGRRSNQGILDLRHYYASIDHIFLNWIEDLPDKRGGWVQSLYFVMMMYLFKARKIVVIWVMHNKVSHYDSNRLLKRFLIRLMIRKSDYIITHSREGLRTMNHYGIEPREKARFFPHPLKKNFIEFNKDRSIDILIWGSVIPYKGVDKFLSYLHQNNLDKRYKILIAGKVNPENYEKTITSYCNEFIQLDNKYISEEELMRYVADSRIILFTYIGDSVLSSGVLMISLSFGANVLAPNVGAFKDAEKDGLINTYETYADAIELLNKGLSSDHSRSERIDAFIKDNTWTAFTAKVSKWMIENDPINENATTYQNETADSKL